jgi:hypothetical protein
VFHVKRGKFATFVSRETGAADSSRLIALSLGCPGRSAASLLGRGPYLSSQLLGPGSAQQRARCCLSGTRSGGRWRALPPKSAGGLNLGISGRQLASLFHVKRGWFRPFASRDRATGTMPLLLCMGLFSRNRFFAPEAALFHVKHPPFPVSASGFPASEIEVRSCEQSERASTSS